jgi:hypothetical protein
MTIIKTVLLVGVVLWVVDVSAHADGPANRARSPEVLRAEIQALQAPRVAWREIAWKSCLLDGLRESHAKKKPALLWVFIDRPIDDARC